MRMKQKEQWVGYVRAKERPSLDPGSIPRVHVDGYTTHRLRLTAGENSIRMDPAKLGQRIASSKMASFGQWSLRKQGTSKMASFGQRSLQR
jgi:hypothetical protein